jgi:hypothetical protein
MTDDFFADPSSLTDDQRRQLHDAYINILQALEDDPVGHEAMIGVLRIAAYLDGRPGTERRNTDD